MKKEYITRRKKSALTGFCTIAGIGVIAILITVISAIAYSIVNYPIEEMIIFSLIFFLLPSMIFAVLYFYYRGKEKKMPDSE